VSQNFARKYTIPIVDGQTDVPWENHQPIACH
jgi:hypothetical protein